MGDIVNIKLQAWWLLVIPLFLVFSLFVIALIMKGKTNEEEKNIKKEREKKKTLTSWIEKKDILYWLLIMCLAAISIFTFQYSGDKNVISHWGFAGTIVSIILAVVAIGFTLYQSLSSEFSSSKIIESAEIISRVSQELNSSDLARSGEIINNAANDMNTYHTKLEEKIISRVTNEIGDLKSHHESKLEDFFKNIFDLQNDRMAQPNIETENIVISIDDFVDNMLNGFSSLTKTSSYVVLYLTFINVRFLSKNVDSFDFVEKLSFLEDPSIKELTSDFGRGLEMGTNSTSIVRTEEWLTQFGILDSFKDLDEENKREILIKIEKHVNEEVVKLIKSYFK